VELKREEEAIDAALAEARHRADHELEQTESTLKEATRILVLRGHSRERLDRILDSVMRTPAKRSDGNHVAKRIGMVRW